MLTLCLTALGYEETTKYYFPLISERNTTGYINNITVSNPIVGGPFGFGHAVHLGPQQVQR